MNPPPPEGIIAPQLRTGLHIPLLYPYWKIHGVYLVHIPTACCEINVYICPEDNFSKHFTPSSGPYCFCPSSMMLPWTWRERHRCLSIQQSFIHSTVTSYESLYINHCYCKKEPLWQIYRFKQKILRGHFDNMSTYNSRNFILQVMNFSPFYTTRHGFSLKGLASNPIKKYLMTQITVRLLLHHWTHLVKVSIGIFKAHCWLRPLINFSPSVSQSIFWYYAS